MQKETSNLLQLSINYLSLRSIFQWYGAVIRSTVHAQTTCLLGKTAWRPSISNACHKQQPNYSESIADDSGNYDFVIISILLIDITIWLPLARPWKQTIKHGTDFFTPFFFFFFHPSKDRSVTKAQISFWKAQDMRHNSNEKFPSQQAKIHTVGEKNLKLTHAPKKLQNC